MKYLFFLLCIQFAFLPVFSQVNDTVPDTSTTSKFMPKAGDKGFSIVVDGLINNISIGPKNNPFGNNILFGRYYNTDKLAYRIGFGLSLTNSKREKADSTGQELVEVDSTYRTSSISISFGLEKHLSSYRRLDPYIAADISLAFINKTVREIETREISAAGTDKTERTITQDGGLGVGLTGSFGFNYFLAPKFSIGSELGIGLSVIRRGGATTDNTVHTPINGTADATYITRSDKTTDFNIGVAPRASIHLSYFF